MSDSNTTRALLMLNESSTYFPRSLVQPMSMALLETIRHIFELPIACYIYIPFATPLHPSSRAEALSPHTFFRISRSHHHHIPPTRPRISSGSIVHSSLVLDFLSSSPVIFSDLNISHLHLSFPCSPAILEIHRNNFHFS